jgi:hypothetical protein
MRYKLEEKSKWYRNKTARCSQRTNIRRIKRSITRTKSWTNKKTLEICPRTHSNPYEKESTNPSDLTNGSWVVMLWEKLWPSAQGNHIEKPQAKSHKNQTHESKWVRLENHIATLVMRCEQPEFMNHVFSKLSSITYIGREGVDGSMLGLVR